MPSFAQKTVFLTSRFNLRHIPWLFLLKGNRASYQHLPKSTSCAQLVVNAPPGQSFKVMTSWHVCTCNVLCTAVLQRKVCAAADIGWL